MWINVKQIKEQTVEQFYKSMKGPVEKGRK